MFTSILAKGQGKEPDFLHPFAAAFCLLVECLPLTLK